MNRGRGYAPQRPSHRQAPPQLRPRGPPPQTQGMQRIAPPLLSHNTGKPRVDVRDLARRPPRNGNGNGNSNGSHMKQDRKPLPGSNNIQRLQSGGASRWPNSRGPNPAGGDRANAPPPPHPRDIRSPRHPLYEGQRPQDSRRQSDNRGVAAPPPSGSGPGPHVPNHHGSHGHGALSPSGGRGPNGHPSGPASRAPLLHHTSRINPPQGGGAAPNGGPKGNNGNSPPYRLHAQTAPRNMPVNVNANNAPPPQHQPRPGAPHQAPLPGAGSPLRSVSSIGGLAYVPQAHGGGARGGHQVGRSVAPIGSRRGLPLPVGQPGAGPILGLDVNNRPHNYMGRPPLSVEGTGGGRMQGGGGGGGGMGSGAGSKRAFGSITPPSEILHPKQGPPKRGAWKRPVPQPLIQLRTQIADAVSKQASAKDYSKLAVGAVVKSVRPLVDALPGDFLTDLLDPISYFLGLRPEQLSGKFKQRVCGTLHTQLVEFMNQVFARELEQLLEAAGATTADPTNDVKQKCIKSKLDDISSQRAAAAAAVPTAVATYPSSSARLSVPLASAAAGLQTSVSSNKSSSSPAVAATSSSPEQRQLNEKLSKAALDGEIASVRQCLALRADINSAVTNGWTALMNATLQGHVQVVNELIAAGADSNLKDDGGFTALMYACSYGHVNIAETLVRAGANVNDADNTGRTIFSYASNPSVRDAVNRGLATRGLPPLSSSSSNASTVVAAALQTTVAPNLNVNRAANPASSPLLAPQHMPPQQYQPVVQQRNGQFAPTSLPQPQQQQQQQHLQQQFLQFQQQQQQNPMQQQYLVQQPGARQGFTQAPSAQARFAGPNARR